MIRHWFTSPDAPIEQSFVKRFDPWHWTVDFPRGAIASVVAGPDKHSLTVHAEFLRRGDLVGLIFESEDRHMHAAHRRETSEDYSHCQLQFDWSSEGLMPLDAVNGPTLTIEGLDERGSERNWYVRLWNYAEGSPETATIRLDFDNMFGGFMLNQTSERVYPRQIRRMFISLPPGGFAPGSDACFPMPQGAKVTVSGIVCTGSGSTLAINDAVVPEHSLRICTAYDDLYHLTPQRVIDAVERLGYRKVINHYVGMSHYFALGGNGLVDAGKTLNSAALAWHQGFAEEAKRRGYEIIWSLSYELLDMFCPEEWKQRDWDGNPALTGYTPPSTLLSPAVDEAMSYLARIGVQLMLVAAEAKLAPKFQIGEPWWWIDRFNRPCIYDPAARNSLGEPLRIEDVRGEKTLEEQQLLDAAGALLAASTARVGAMVRQAAPNVELLLLTYLCGSLDPKAPHLERLNLPLGWAKPAFDVLQLEDYEWVTAGRRSLSRSGVARASARLGYVPGSQHYLSGFVATGDDRLQWNNVLRSACDAQKRGTAEVFLWAFPQVLRDSLTIFGESDEVQSYDDVLFPIEIGAEASVAPGFSTTVITSSSGHEYRNANWSQGRLRFDAGPGIRGDEELETLISFFRARRGSATAFRFRDPYDFSSNRMTDATTPHDQVVGTGDGVATQFSLQKTYGTGEVRRITRPVPGTVRVAVAGVEHVGGWELLEGGTISFAEPPDATAIVTAGFLFDVPVRFGSDQLEISRASFRAGEAPSVPLIEVREVQQ